MHNDHNLTLDKLLLHNMWLTKRETLNEQRTYNDLLASAASMEQRHRHPAGVLQNYMIDLFNGKE